MSIEEKQNSPTYQDSDSIEYPQNERDVAILIRKFYKSNIPIELIGSGSKRKIGKAIQCAKTLNLSKLSGIIEYLPEELYIKVKAGTPIKDIEEKLNQVRSPFRSAEKFSIENIIDPRDTRKLLCEWFIRR